MTMFEALMWFGLGMVIYFYIVNRQVIEERNEERFGFSAPMSLKNAILVVELTDIDNTSKIWYVGECQNPDSTISHDASFANFIFGASCYENRNKAIEHAEEMNRSIRPRYGVLVYDGFSNYTFGQLMSKYNPAAVQPQ